MKIVSVIQRNRWFERIPLKTFFSFLSLRAFKKLKIWNMTKTLKTKVKCLLGTLKILRTYWYYFSPERFGSKRIPVARCVRSSFEYRTRQRGVRYSGHLRSRA